MTVACSVKLKKLKKVKKFSNKYKIIQKIWNSRSKQIHANNINYISNNKSVKN